MKVKKRKTFITAALILLNTSLISDFAFAAGEPKHPFGEVPAPVKSTQVTAKWDSICLSNDGAVFYNQSNITQRYYSLNGYGQHRDLSYACEVTVYYCEGNRLTSRTKIVSGPCR